MGAYGPLKGAWQSLHRGGEGSLRRARWNEFSPESVPASNAVQYSDRSSGGGGLAGTGAWLTTSEIIVATETAGEEEQQYTKQ